MVRTNCMQELSAHGQSSHGKEASPLRAVPFSLTDAHPLLGQPSALHSSKAAAALKDDCLPQPGHWALRVRATRFKSGFGTQSLRDLSQALHRSELPVSFVNRRATPLSVSGR